MKTEYIADDGKRFDTSDACMAHEETLGTKLLLGLTQADVDAALARTNIPLADLIERLGRQIAKTRVESGDVRRRAKKTVAAAEELPLAPDDPAENHLAIAYRVAEQGKAAFDRHYAGLTDEGRAALEGHVSKIIAVAKEADLPL